MPRQPRLDVPGCLHHLMARGIERRNIFLTKADYEDFFHRLELAREKAPVQILAWALMPNHFHLLARGGERGIIPFMRSLMTGYATAFNLRHRRVGHLFQNRYKSTVCDEDAYLKELVRYIHLNPLRAGLVRDLKELSVFPYCGHSVLMGSRKASWQDLDEVLSLFARKEHDARRVYEEFVAEGVKRGKRPDLMGGGLQRSHGGWVPRSMDSREMYDSRVLGLGDFVEQVLEKAERMEKNQKKLQQKTLSEMSYKIASFFDIPAEALQQKGRRAPVADGKAVLAYIGVEYLGRTAKQMGEFLRLCASAVSQARVRGERLCVQRGLDKKLDLDELVNNVGQPTVR